MQSLRNLVWRIIGVVTVLVFGLVLILSKIFAGEFSRVPTSAILAVYGALLLGILNRIRFLRLGETLVHEVGHAQMAALTFGNVSYIRLERDTSGVTYHSQARFFPRITTALVSLFGPISSAVVFSITARLVASELAGYWALGMGIFIVLILITTVRNLWGWIVGIVLLGILYLELEASGYINPHFLSLGNLNKSNSVFVVSILVVAAFNLGSALQYSFKVRSGRNPNSDEYRFAKSLFMSGFLGGYLIIVIQMLLALIGISFLLGWSSPIHFGRFV